MDAISLNESAVKTMNSLADHGYFGDLSMYDEEMKNNSDPFNRKFYSSIQDKISQINGELLVAYYTMRADFKAFISVRKQQMKLEAEGKSAKLAGNEIVEDLIKAEIPELHRAVIILEGWQARADSSLKTARNHTYEGKEVEKEDRSAS